MIKELKELWRILYLIFTGSRCKHKDGFDKQGFCNLCYELVPEWEQGDYNGKP